MPRRKKKMENDDNSAGANIESFTIDENPDFEAHIRDVDIKPEKPKKVKMPDSKDILIKKDMGSFIEVTKRDGSKIRIDK